MTTRIGYCFDGNMIMSVNAIKVQGPIFVQQPIRPVRSYLSFLTFTTWYVFLKLCPLSDKMNHEARKYISCFLKHFKK